MNNYSLEVNSIDCCFGLSRNIRGDYQIVKTYFMFNVQLLASLEMLMYMLCLSNLISFQSK